MTDVNYIKQKAIEIANNSLPKIIAGVINQKDVSVDCCSSDFFLDASYFPENYLSPVSRAARDERRRDRKQARLNRIKSFNK